MLKSWAWAQMVVVASATTAALAFPIAAQEVACTAEGDDPAANVADCTTVLARIDLPRLERARAFNNRALNHIELGDYDRAEDDLQRAIALVPSDPAFYNNAAYLMEQKGDLDAAYTYYQFALRHEADPDLRAGFISQLDRLRAQQ